MWPKQPKHLARLTCEGCKVVRLASNLTPTRTLALKHDSDESIKVHLHSI